MTFTRPSTASKTTAKDQEAADAAMASVRSQKLFPKQNVLTVQQVADALQLTKQHVINLIEACEIGAIDVGGNQLKKDNPRRNYRIPVSAYDTFIEKRKFF